MRKRVKKMFLTLRNICGRLGRKKELYMLGAEIETYVSADETVLGTVLSWMESEKQ